MMREVMLVGGPGDGKLVMIEHDQREFAYVNSGPMIVWTKGPVEPLSSSPTRYIYAPRRNGDYSWYIQQGEL
jgi:hypothetical protein